MARTFVFSAARSSTGYPWLFALSGVVIAAGVCSRLLLPLSWMRVIVGGGHIVVVLFLLNRFEGWRPAPVELDPSFISCSGGKFHWGEIHLVEIESGSGGGWGSRVDLTRIHVHTATQSAEVASSDLKDFIPLCHRVFALVEAAPNDRLAVLESPLGEDGTLPRVWTREAGVTRRLETSSLVRGSFPPGSLRYRWLFLLAIKAVAFLAIPFGPGPDWKWAIALAGVALGVWLIKAGRALWGEGAGLRLYSDRVILIEKDREQSFPLSEVSFVTRPYGAVELTLGERTLCFWAGETGQAVLSLVRTLQDEVRG